MILVSTENFMAASQNSEFQSKVMCSEMSGMLSQLTLKSCWKI